MKSIAIFLILFIIKSSISKDNIEDYSFEKFITRLKSEGVYEKIRLIKKALGEDLSIIFCEELIKNGYGNCKKLVKEYMPFSPLKQRLNSQSFEDREKRKNPDLKLKHKWDKLYEILRKILPPEKARLKAKRIIERVEREIPRNIIPLQSESITIS